MNDNNRRLTEWIAAHEAETLAMLKEIVELESPTTDRDAVNAVGEWVKRKALELGASVETVPSGAADRGDHLVARWEGEERGLAPVLLIAHLDTVWEKGTLQKMPFRVEEDKVYGPGVFDMKGAVVFALMAVKALKALNRGWRRPLTFLFNSDEEINSATSREVIAREAQRSHCALIPEGGVGDAVLTSRKGIMYFKVTAKGRSSHAGMDHEKGINAIEEIAHQVLAIQRKTDYAKGTTVSCGIVSGGTRTNVVPAEAVVEVDARVPNTAEMDRLKAEMESLAPHLPGAQLEVFSLVKRPPLDRSEGVVQLYHHAKRLAAELDSELPETSTGAISDGNLTAAMGVPTLDGLGPVGDGAHAVHEHIVRGKMTRRIALLALLLETL